MRRTTAAILGMAAVALGMLFGFSGTLPVRAQVTLVAKPMEVLRAIALALDSSGSLLSVEGGQIRKLTPEGSLRIIAGTGRQGHRGDGGPAVDAGFEYADDVAVDAKGNIYIADNLGHRVRLITPDGKIQTFAGIGTPGYSGDAGPAAAAKLQ